MSATSGLRIHAHPAVAGVSLNRTRLDTCHDGRVLDAEDHRDGNPQQAMEVRWASEVGDVGIGAPQHWV